MQYQLQRQHQSLTPLSCVHLLAVTLVRTGKLLLSALLIHRKIIMCLLIELVILSSLFWWYHTYVLYEVVIPMERRSCDKHFHSVLDRFWTSNYTPFQPLHWLQPASINGLEYANVDLMNLMPVLLFGLHSPQIQRTLHLHHWREENGFLVFPYNITQTTIHALFDGSLVEREVVEIFSDDPIKVLHAKQRQHDRDLRLVFHHFYTTCSRWGNAPFLLAEDDVQPCNGSSSDFAFLRAWLHLHEREWGMIRVGVGTTGLIMKCSHIPPFLGQPWGPLEGRAIDWALSRFYLDHAKWMGRELVFYHNIIEHPRGIDSNIWDRNETTLREGNGIPECHKPILWVGYSPASQHNYLCNHSFFSPCDTTILSLPRSKAMRIMKTGPGKYSRSMHNP